MPLDDTFFEDPLFFLMIRGQLVIFIVIMLIHSMCYRDWKYIIGLLKLIKVIWWRWILNFFFVACFYLLFDFFFILKWIKLSKLGKSLMNDVLHYDRLRRLFISLVLFFLYVSSDTSLFRVQNVHGIYSLLFNFTQFLDFLEFSLLFLG